MSCKTIAIFSLKDDLHALATKEALKKYADLLCHVVDTDTISGASRLKWYSSSQEEMLKNPTLPTRDGEAVDVSSIDLIWWRRANHNQRLSDDIRDPTYIDLINNECIEAVFGITMSDFKGKWVNHPNSSRVADNKLVQMRAAHSVGFSIPKTLVSQDPDAVRHFYQGLGKPMIVKPLRGTRKAALVTAVVTDELLTCDDNIRLCPAIYQEYIEGCKHLRAHCFGDEIVCVEIESPDVDWRPDLNVPIRHINMPDDLKRRLKEILKLLDLKMGIADLKISITGEVFWLEINPQGQFLFVEALTGIKLTEIFAQYLYSEVTN